MSDSLFHKMISTIFTIGAILLGAASACSPSGNNSSETDDSVMDVIPAVPDTVASPATANLHNPLPSLPTPLLLAGNFAELRNNHFHSGVDFKTGGRTGIKVVAADSGYVSRILVSPWGFGRAVYIDHPRTGLTTVYGHLEAFSPVIDKVAKDIQYEREEFSIDINLEPGQIPVKRGEMIGLSGNAGSSGGPHLHMDVRHTATEDAVDPIPYFKNILKDNVAPEMRKLSIYAVPGEGAVGSPSSFVPGKNGSYVFTAWGKVYPGIKAYDRMSGTQNIYGIKYLTLVADGDTVYKRTLDRFSFDSTRAVHTLIDNPSLKRGGEWIMTTRIPEANHLEANIQHIDRGIIDIDEVRSYSCEFILGDEFGNITKIPFIIKGTEMPIQGTKNENLALSHNIRNNLSGNGINISIPAFARYDNLPLNFSSEKSSIYYSDIHTIGDYTEALHFPVEIEIDINADTLTDIRKYTLVRLSEKDNGRTAVPATYINGKMKAKISNFGRYAITADHTVPTIKKLQGAPGLLSYRISDNLSGIENYRGEIDGKFALFELDGKTAKISYNIDYKRFPKSGKRHKINIEVIDAAGNKATFTDSVVF